MRFPSSTCYVAKWVAIIRPISCSAVILLLTASDSAPAASVPVAPITQAPIEPLPNTVNAATASNSEGTNSLKDDIDRYPANPSIVPDIPEGVRYWKHEYAGEIEGYVYSIGQGYFPEAGSFTYIEPESHLPGFYDIVDP